MTPEQEALLRKTLSAMENLHKDVAVISKALNHKTTAINKEESIQDIANLIITQAVLKGKGNNSRKN